MAVTSNLNFPLLAGFRQSRPAGAVWPTIVADPPVRHPSRPKYGYRVRGSRGLTSPGAEHHRPSVDQRAVWALQTETTKSRLKTRSTAKISATVMSLGIVLGGYVILQVTLPTPLPDPGLAALQQAPALDTVVADDSLQVTQPANLGRAPSVPMTPPNLVAEPVEQRSPEARQLPPPPLLSETAPGLGQAPEVLDVPAVIAMTSRAPATTLPARPAQPVALSPFVCVTCNRTIPAFDGVSFAVQTNDAASATTTQLVAALVEYDVDLRTSTIPFPSSEVRYYRAQDAAPARALAGQYDARLVDLTWIASQSGTPRIDIILAGSSD